MPLHLPVDHPEYEVEPDPVVLSKADEEAVLEGMTDQDWRLSHLYKIVDKQGRLIQFTPNWSQRQLANELTLRHIILKARQLGMTTWIQLLMLDTVLFTPNFNATTIAHDLQSLQAMFYRNIKAGYDNLPEPVQEQWPFESRSTSQMKMANGSVIQVALSTRSGTVQFLHVSEFGKICAKYPLKAKEVVTGAFQSVPRDGVIVIESTAEGNHGTFHDMTMEAHRAQTAGEPRGPLDWSLTFLPWWRHPEYTIPPASSVIPAPLRKEFDELEAKTGAKIGAGRRAWYNAQWKVLGSDMKQEYPGTVEEAFEQNLEGAYYASQMTLARREGRIVEFPHETSATVETWWDLGMADATGIWFVQHVGLQTRLLWYYQATGEGLAHYAQVLAEKGREGRWTYGEHVAPHDIKVRELGGGFGEGLSRLQVAQQLGIRFTVCPQHAVVDGIEAVRNAFTRFWIHPACDEYGGIKALDNYRKEWDEVRATYRTKPLHDWTSHAADALRTGIMGAGARVKAGAHTPQDAPANWGL